MLRVRGLTSVGGWVGGQAGDGGGRRSVMSGECRMVVVGMVRVDGGRLVWVSRIVQVADGVVRRIAASDV